MLSWSPRYLGLAVGALLILASGRPDLSARQARFDPALYSGLTWRLLGPFRGGRVDAVSGVVGRPNEFYFGAVNGGVWKSIDAGRVWQPVFDGQPVASIGALAVAPSNPNVVYVGTGESTLRDSVGYGSGMYKSIDAGRTWTHIGLDDTQHIGRVAVDPKNADVVFVAVIGHLYEAHPDRGVFKTVDGGKTWKKVLYKDDSLGSPDVVIDPTNSAIVYASLWNTRRPPWYTYQPSNGPGGGLFKSIDAGATWTQLTRGLPAECVGKAGIGISASNPHRVYAVIDDFLTEGAVPGTSCPPTPSAGTGGRGAGRGGTAGSPPAQPSAPQQGGFYRSDDAGLSWTKLSGDSALWGRGWYFEHIAVDPKNPDIVYVPNIAVSRSKDGGRTWVVLRGSPGGDDYQGAWISPDDPNTMILASDQGAIVTRNATTDDPREVTWSSWLNQPTAQIYHVSSDYRVPYWVTGAQQDSGAVAVRTRGKFAQISMRDWEPIGPGGESGMTAGDPLHPGIVFGGTGLQRYDLALNAPVGRTSAPVAPEPARTDWTQPLVFSKADPHALYYANQFLFRTTDDAQTWTRISDDLTRPDPGVPSTLDPVSAEDTDRNGKRGVIYAIAPSPLQKDRIWVGTDDGLIQMTTDGGTVWQNVTPPALTSWSRVTTIEASHFDAAEVYATVDRHQLNDFDPHLYRTRDSGTTWQEVTRGLAKGAYLHTVKEDPQRRGLLFAGSERAMYLSFDDGDTWQSLQLNLPASSMRDLEIHGDDLIVATHGRGFWIIDDISPLRQINDEVAAADAFLFRPAGIVDLNQGGDNGTPLQRDEPQAQNPPNGASIDYYLKETVSGPVTLEILDQNGAVLTTFTNGPAQSDAGRGGRGRGGRGPGGGIPNLSPLWQTAPEPFSVARGMHRVIWGPPRGGPGGRAVMPASPAGSFTARLTVNGTTYTQTFTVK